MRIYSQIEKQHESYTHSETYTTLWDIQFDLHNFQLHIAQTTNKCNKLHIQ